MRDLPENWRLLEPDERIGRGDAILSAGGRLTRDLPPRTIRALAGVAGNRIVRRERPRVKTAVTGLLETGRACQVDNPAGSLGGPGAGR